MSLIITALKPSGFDMALHCEAREWGDRLSAGHLTEATHQETGEIIDNPIRWFRRAYLRINTTSDGLVPLACFLDALPIEDLGAATAAEMAKAFDTPEIACAEILAVLKSDLAAIERIDRIPLVGPGLIAAVQNAPREELLRELENLLQEFKLEPFRARAGKAPLHGMRVVFTGTFGDVTRGEAETMAVQAGAAVTSSVGKRVSFVVAGTAPGAKLTKAQELGVKVIDFKEFRVRIGAS